VTGTSGIAARTSARARGEDKAVCLSQTEGRQMLKIAVDRFEHAPSLTRSGGLSRRSAVREAAAQLDDLCDSSVFFDFPFS
jgi:hypothetical protein